MTGQHQNHEPGLLLLERVLCRLDTLQESIDRLHREEHRANAYIVAQLEEIASGADAEQAAKLHALAAKLNKIAPIPNTTPPTNP